LMISKKEQASFWATLSPHQIFFFTFRNIDEKLVERNDK
jgi:hypothetical protein